MKNITLILLTLSLTGCWTSSNTNTAIKSTRDAVVAQQVTDTVDKVSDNQLKKKQIVENTKLVELEKDENVAKSIKQVIDETKNEDHRLELAKLAIKAQSLKTIREERTKQALAMYSALPVAGVVTLFYIIITIIILFLLRDKFFVMKK